jgi:hypothetical protein
MGTTVIRVPFDRSLSEQQIREQGQTIARCPFDLFACFTVTTPDPADLEYHTIRGLQLLREEMGVSPRFVDIGNEDNASHSHTFQRDPVGYARAVNNIVRRLRDEEGYGGDIFAGSINALSAGRKVFGITIGSGGLDWLRKVWAALTVEVGCSPHRYPTGLDPAEPAHYHRTRLDEWTMLRDLIGPTRPVIIGEIGATDHNQTPEAAAASIRYDLDWWTQHTDVIGLVAYAIQDEARHYSLVTPQLAWKPQAQALADWSAATAVPERTPDA